MGQSIENELALRVGAPVGIPPTGVKKIFLDVDGSAKTLDSTGTKATLGGAGSTWFDLEAQAHAAAVPQLTKAVAFRPIDLTTLITATCVDAQVEGGGIRNSSDTLFTLLSKATMAQNAQTSKFGVSFLASLSPIAVGKASYVGLVDAASATKELAIATQQSNDAANFHAFGYDGAALTSPLVTLGAADANVYSWRITSDATTVTISRCAAAGGGAALSSGTILTNVLHFPTGRLIPAIFNSAATVGQVVYGVVYSYVG